MCRKEGALFILDEVMTGFRLAWGGAAELFDLDPDMVCYGKIIGGGMPVGAFGGKRKIFECLAPQGGVYQAGTLSGNPVAMTSGITTLQLLREDPLIYEKLEAKTNRLAENLKNAIQKSGVDITVNHCGSMLSLFFSKEKIHDYTSAKSTDTALFAGLFHKMLAAGIYLPPSNFESWFISTALTEDQIDKIGAEVADFIHNLR